MGRKKVVSVSYEITYGNKENTTAFNRTFTDFDRLSNFYDDLMKTYVTVSDIVRVTTTTTRESII